MKTTRSVFVKKSRWPVDIAKDKVVRAAVAFQDAMDAYVDAVARDLVRPGGVKKQLDRANLAQTRLAQTVKAYKAARRKR